MRTQKKHVGFAVSNAEFKNYKTPDHNREYDKSTFGVYVVPDPKFYPDGLTVFVYQEGCGYQGAFFRLIPETAKILSEAINKYLGQKEGPKKVVTGGYRWRE
jgi:hypothetical protein